jgi:hypothetical protein
MTIHRIPVNKLSAKAARDEKWDYPLEACTRLW